MTGAGTLERATVVSDNGSDGLAEPKIRFTIIFHAPFDRVLALTSLGAMGVVLAGWATPSLVRIAGSIIAAVTLPWACRLLVRELKTPRTERGVDFKVDVLTPRPLSYVDTIGDR